MKISYPYDDDVEKLETAAFLGMLRKAPVRSESQGDLLALAQRLDPCPFRAFVHTLAIHDLRYAYLGDMEMDCSDVDDLITAAGDGSYLLSFGHDDLQNRYRAMMGNGGVSIRRTGPEDEEDEVYSGLDCLIDQLVTCTDEKYLPVDYVTCLHDKIQDSRAEEVFRDIDLHVEEALKRSSRGEVGFLPLGEPRSETALENADDVACGAVRARGDHVEVLFLPAEEGGEDVRAVISDSRCIDVELPSRIRYREMWDLSNDESLLAVASHTRARVIDLETGRSTVAMEGPWMTGVACMDDDHLAILTSGGLRQMSLSDPDVYQLSSLRELNRTSGSITAECSPLLHLVDMKGGTRFLYSIECTADSIESVMGGRILVLRRHSGNEDSWGTLVLGFRNGGFAVLAKYALDVGRVYEMGEEVFGSRGFRLLGLEEALKASVPARIKRLTDGMEIDAEVSSPPEKLVSREGRVRLELTTRSRRQVMLPDSARSDLDLGQDDWLPEKSDNSLFLVLRYSGGCYRVSLSRREGESLREIPLGMDIRTETLCYEYTPDGSHMILSMNGGNYLVRTEDGSTGMASHQARNSSSVAIIDASGFLVLSRLDMENGQLDHWRRSENGWSVQSSMPTGLLDSMFYLHRDRLLLLSLKNMPAEKSLTAVLRLSAEGGFIPVDVLEVKTVSAWSDEEGSYLSTEQDVDYGITFEFGTDEEEALSLRYVQPGDGVPPDLLIGRSGDAGRKYGYLDREGEWTIAPRFISAQGFGGSNAAVGLGPHGFKGLVDGSGHFLVPAHASWIGEPSEGFRRTAFAGYPSSDIPGDAMLGMLDPDGRWTLSPSYTFVGEMREGRAPVRFPNGENWVKNDGSRLTDDNWHECGVFSQGLATAGNGNLYGYVNIGGEVVLKARYRSALPFSCGVAGVILQGQKWRCIRSDGRVISTVGYDEFYSHQENLACVRIDRKWGYVDVEGREPFGMNFERTYSFTTGLGVVVTGGRWNFLTVDGRMISDEGWDGAFLPSEGMGSYKINDRFGFVNSRGDIVTDAVFEAVYSFSEGLSAVMSGGRWGYVDKGGELVIKPVFSQVRDFKEGLACVRESDGGPWGYISREGDFVIEPKLSDAYVFCNGLAVASMSDGEK